MYNSNSLKKGFIIDTLDEERKCVETRPERRLLSAVVERALSDLKPDIDRKIKEDSRKWLTEEYTDNPEPFSFQYICMMLDIDFKKVKAHIKEELINT